MIGALASRIPSPDSMTLQVAWTLVILAALVGAMWGVRRAGRWARDRYDGYHVETFELVSVAVLVVTAAASTSVVWGAAEDVFSVFERVGDDPEVVANLVVTALLLGTASFLARILSRIVRNRAEGVAAADHRREVAYRVVQVVVYVTAGITVLGVWGVDLSNLLVGAGFLGIVVGLAARQTLGSVIAGFLLLFARPFEVGDWVVVGDQEGIVTDVTVFNTQIRTFDAERVVIPNDRVTGRDIINRSHEGRLRGTVDVGIDYDADVSRAADIVEAAASEADRVLEAPPPTAVAKEFGDSAVVLELRFWIDDPSARRMWHTRTEVIQRVKGALEDDGVPIPFPQRTLGVRDGVDVGESLARGDGHEAGSPEADPGSANGDGAAPTGSAPESATDDGATGETTGDGEGSTAESGDDTPSAGSNRGDGA